MTRCSASRSQRREDPRLITGQGRYLDDLGAGRAGRRVRPLPARARPHPRHRRGRRRSTSTGWSRSTPGRTCPAGSREPLPLLIPHPALTHGRTAYPLARDVVTARRRAGRHGRRPRPLPRRGRRRAASRWTTSRCKPVVGHRGGGAGRAPGPRRRAGQRRRAPGPGGALGGRAGAREAIDAAPHTLAFRLDIERSASMPLEGRGVYARWDADDRSLRVYSSHPDLHQRAHGDRRQARPAAAQGRGDRARRRRRVRRQDRASVAGGGAGPVGGACCSAARSSGPRTGASTSSPPRTSAAQVQYVRVGFDDDGRVLGLDVHDPARPRRLHAVRDHRPDHHLHPAARPVQARRLPGRVLLASTPTPCRSRRTAGRAARRASSAWSGRWTASPTTSGSDRTGGARGQLHPARRVPLRPGPDLPGRPPADLRLRRLPRVAAACSRS